ncbi:unnamed protein product [Medioppia subpectinata]|uniref:Gamma-interferon-inducible lysosomal thiol reductase n=1 Tax=Medioppia subpectinata TaxID=1979941 RepID=A0A7R9Q5P9_9ACAR|nr:unnamed protein product [Medioppia subpectinata]CAG2113558.1 unnamed protein product [Medioppia subpectinata]
MLQCTGFHLSLYYETLCGDSQKFIKKQLHRAFELFGDQISVELIPFGNVDEYNDTNGVAKFHCQHGIEECRGNKLQSCVYTDFWWKTEAHRKAVINFIVCMFNNKHMKKNAENAAMECTDIWFPGHWPAVKECMTSDKGRDIYRLMARKTRELSPSPTYVPWITIDGKHEKRHQALAENDLVDFICMKANPRPVQCSSAGLLMEHNFENLYLYPLDPNMV